MTDYIKNHIIINDYKTNDDNDKICLICLENNGFLILCSNCKYKYCQDCANKVNNLCSVCIRTKELSSNIYLNINNYTYVYENMADYGIENSHNTLYSNILIQSIIINIIIGFCCIILILFFGYIGAKFIFNIFLDNK